MTIHHATIYDFYHFYYWDNQQIFLCILNGLLLFEQCRPKWPTLTCAFALACVDHIAAPSSKMFSNNLNHNFRTPVRFDIYSNSYTHKAYSMSNQALIMPINSYYRLNTRSDGIRTRTRFLSITIQDNALPYATTQTELPRLRSSNTFRCFCNLWFATGSNVLPCSRRTLSYRAIFNC